MVTADFTPAVSERPASPAEQWQSGFRLALACALAFHAALILGLYTTSPRRVGVAGGSPGAIAVELVSEADLKSHETVRVPPSGRPPAVAAPPPKPEAAPAPETPPPQPKQEAAPAATEPALPDLADVAPPPERVKPAEKGSKSEPPEKKKPAPQARLDLSPPSDNTPSAAPGRSSALTRPPGITRSGENDQFGLGVIRALRATMPPPTGVFGRVTVRLLLNDNGDLTEVRVIESSGKSGLDQSIVFATKQTNFPLPPAGSSVADRTFLISYVYR